MAKKKAAKKKAAKKAARKPAAKEPAAQPVQDAPIASRSARLQRLGCELIRSHNLSKGSGKTRFTGEVEGYQIELTIHAPD